jgi:hypothetical protein
MPPVYSASMPPNLEITDGYTVRLTALDPTTGNQVSGVTVQDLVMENNLLGATTAEQLAYGPFLLVPGPNA